MGFQRTKNRSLQEERERQRARSKRAALRALRKARDAACNASAELSTWETEFLGSVEERIEIYGRAFGDPQKGAPGATLSIRQTGKLKEIAAKAKGRARKS
jgi:hypothetical protein